MIKATEGGDLSEEESGSKLYTNSSSSAVTVLLISLLSFFGAEILTGSTSIEGIVAYPISFVLSLAFYGFQVSIIADISARYSLKTGTVFILGLIYGIFEEGFAIFTMESTQTHTLWLAFAGINVTWTIYVMTLHAVITVSVTLLIMKVIWPARISKPFLTRWSYIIILPVLTIIYLFLMKGAVASGRIPQPFAVIFLIVLAVIMFIFAKYSTKDDTTHRLPANRLSLIPVIPSILWGIFLGIPFLVGNSVPVILIPETVLLAIIAYFLYRYFRKLDLLELEIKHRIMWVTYSAFLVILLALGIFNRTLLSEVFAFSGVILLSYPGWQRRNLHKKYFRYT